ncbi:SchA/CurD-like domain-containing protein [Actinophytocola sp.]|uniref:SchA/CurD-like domain-containing protein n=1 Tax=Actinophytocola sp. TaxID=1872138 RepID=UPI002D7EE0F1|nr:SchA/CurD-like domain-containing protein [Actinophytocola sp.]HET9143576.1 SchA/CurD-like domain-containing protein [Actinophytocola sp.]
MPFVAITYDIKPGCDDELAEIFDSFRRVGSPAVPAGADAPATRILATALFIRDDTMVRFIEYEGDLDTVIRHMASQPGVQEIERKLKPYLTKPRNTATVEGFVATFRSSMLRCISQLAVPRTPSGGAAKAS